MPKGLSETIHYVRIGQGLRRFAASVRFFEEAYLQDPSPILSPDVGRTLVARAAVNAGCDPGNDDPPRDEPRRAGLRGPALAWLRPERALGQSFWQGGNDLLLPSRHRIRATE